MKSRRPDMELGYWVTGSMGHLGHLPRPGHRVIILTRCETQVAHCKRLSHNYGTNIALPGTMQCKSCFLAPDINTLTYLLTLSSTRVLDKMLDRVLKQ